MCTDTDLDSKLAAHRDPRGEDDGGNEAAAVEQRDTQALAVIPRRDACEAGDAPEGETAWEIQKRTKTKGH